MEACTLGDHRSDFGAYKPLAADGYRVLSFDFRGHGQSSATRPYTFEQIVDDVEGLRSHFAAASRVVIIGGSFGGFLAQRYAIKYATAVSHLILRGTAPSYHRKTTPPLAAIVDITGLTAAPRRFQMRTMPYPSWSSACTWPPVFRRRCCAPRCSGASRATSSFALFIWPCRRCTAKSSTPMLPCAVALGTSITPRRTVSRAWPRGSASRARRD